MKVLCKSLEGDLMRLICMAASRGVLGNFINEEHEDEAENEREANISVW